MSKHRIETILFDLDGTLINSFQAFCEVAYQTCEALDFPKVEINSLKEVVNTGSSFFDYLLPDDLALEEKTKRKEAFITKSNEIRLDIFRKHITIFPEVLPLLQRLRSQGYKLGIVTSSRKEMFQLQNIKPLASFMDVIISRDSVEKQKPDPEGILLAIKELKGKSATTLFIGDTPLDIQAGTNAGVLTAGVLSGTSTSEALEGEGAHFLFSSLTELSTLLHADRSRSNNAPLLQGRYRKGLNVANRFLRIPSIVERIEENTSYRPYPGTLNVILVSSSLRLYTQLVEEGCLRQTPISFEGYCDASLYSAALFIGHEKYPVHILIPHVDQYEPNKVEFISSRKLADATSITNNHSIFFWIEKK